MARHRRLRSVRGVHPDVMVGAVMVKEATVLAQVSFE
jgi:hypothetical protein